MKLIKGLLISLLAVCFSVYSLKCEAFAFDFKENYMAMNHITNMSFSEWKNKCPEFGLSEDECLESYAINELKNGKKHLSISSDDGKYFEFFKFTALDEIIEFFKTKINYNYDDYKKELLKTKIKHGIVGALLFWIFSYGCFSLIIKHEKNLPNKIDKTNALIEKKEKNDINDKVESELNFQDKENKKEKSSLIPKRLKVIASSLLSCIASYCFASWAEIDFKNKENSRYAQGKKSIMDDILRGIKENEWQNNDYICFVFNSLCQDDSEAFWGKRNIVYSENDRNNFSDQFKKLGDALIKIIPLLYSDKDDK